MKYKFKGRDIISINDFTRDELLYIFKIANKFEKKTNPKHYRAMHSLLAGMAKFSGNKIYS